MAKKASAVKFDRINLRIRLDLKRSIEKAISEGRIPFKTFADYLSAIATADMEVRGLHPAAGGAAPKAKKKAARKTK